MMSDEKTIEAAPALASDEEAAAAIERIGFLQRELAKIDTAKAKKVAEASKEAEDRATPIHDEMRPLQEGVEAWCNAERVRLTDGNRSKTATFTTGTCSWRKGRGRVVVEATMKEKVLDRLKKLAGFTRPKIEIDLAAVSKAFAEDPKTPLRKIPGLSFEAGTESFFISPTGAELVERS